MTVRAGVGCPAGSRSRSSPHPVTKVPEWQGRTRDSHAISAYPGLYVEPWLRADIIEDATADGFKIARVPVPLEPGTTVHSSGVPE